MLNLRISKTILFLSKSKQGKHEYQLDMNELDSERATIVFLEAGKVVLKFKYLKTMNNSKPSYKLECRNSQVGFLWHSQFKFFIFV